jgi:hypothetical protein
LDPTPVDGLVTSGDEGRLHTSPTRGPHRGCHTRPGCCLCW